MKLKTCVYIDSAHKLDLPYKSKCNNLHGHRWGIEVTLITDTMSGYGMVIDFSKIKGYLNRYDHVYLNEMPELEGIQVVTDDPLGPFGAKESGEGTQLAPAPAIVNAIYDAIGIDFDTLPVTPEQVLKALQEKRTKP